MPTKALSERPPKVSLAVKFFYVVVGIGIIRAAMTIIRHADVRSPYFLIYTKIIIYAGSLYLIYQLNKGRNWAKWLLVVIFIIAIPLVILPVFVSYSHNPVDTLLGFIQTALYIIGLVFLFHRSSSSWFGAEKISKKSER
jgi:RsiW-degrading membrane proteinase PrsW (M82 family)